MVACLQLRPHNLGALYTLPGVGDFIIDLLLSCAHSEVRSTALEQFFTLSQTDINPEKIKTHHPKHFLLQMLVSKPVPLWNAHTLVRGVNSNAPSTLISDVDCLKDYLSKTRSFSTSIHLLFWKMSLTGFRALSQGSYGVWSLRGGRYDVGRPPQAGQGTPQLQGNRQRENGEVADQSSIERVHVPLISADPQESICHLWRVDYPLCGDKEWRRYLLHELCATTALHDTRCQGGILSANVSSHNTDNVFYQMQMLLGHLWESKLQYFEPDQFWRVFKFWGEPVNIREQQDAFDFFTILIDQIDGFLKEKKQKEVFRPKFQGVFLNQMICHGCPHRGHSRVLTRFSSESLGFRIKVKRAQQEGTEEEFFALNLGIKSESLEASLEQFIQGEMLEGENAYLCEDCNEKRNTIKRTCIKTLPPVLVIQLKRFGYDWEAGRALKFDDYFKFPWVIDMEPYTSKGIKRREQEATSHEEQEDEGADKKNVSTQSTEDLYQLVGIVVHSGQANAGHYYSFIRDRWSKSANGNPSGTSSMIPLWTNLRWETRPLRPSVSAEATNQNHIAAQAVVTQQIPSRDTGVDTCSSTRESQSTEIKNPCEVTWGEPRYLNRIVTATFTWERERVCLGTTCPGHPEVIRDENLQFLRDRAIYNQEYFNFIRSLATCNLRSCFSEDFEHMSEISMQLAVQFLVNTFFRTHKKLRYDLGEWCGAIESISKHSHRACRWALSYFAKEGADNLCMFLLECITSEIREAFAKVVECIMANFILKHSCPPESPEMRP
ncbi:Ubiquitin carboxyl-terminal hydrolase 24 [Apostichopus japonicus]|uniref:Ubiquitin carboxyl-terminal hydrolase 24 n=1 Tax=Stichopus japonicus TaxID=307972 RepID=A0A2G8LKW2_STIJA|nr:Ubiquitin carboxyl-terminal hydrolase 24 [Apostichopus japonicus]